MDGHGRKKKKRKEPIKEGEARMGVIYRSDRESSVISRDRQRAADEERKKKEAQEKGSRTAAERRWESRMGKSYEKRKCRQRAEESIR